jgi:Tol biopolymer transport system component
LTSGARGATLGGVHWGPALGAALVLLFAAGGGAATVEAPLVVATTRADLFHDDVFVLDTVTGRMRNLTRHPASDRSAVASPDGRLVAFVSDRDGEEAIWVVPSAGGKARKVSRRLLRDDDWWLERLQWRPDGAAIAYHWTSPGPYGIGIVTLSGRPILQRPRGLSSWWLTGKRLAVDTGTVLVMYAAGGDVTRRRPSTGLVAISRRGDTAFVRGGHVEVFDGRGRRIARVRGTSASWRPDGLSLAVMRGPGISLVRLDGRVTTLSRTLNGLSWSPDGRWILAEDDLQRPRAISSANGRVRSLPAAAFSQWSQDGTLAGISQDGLVVARPGGRVKVVARTSYQSGCESGLETFSWVDRRRLVLVQGGAGQNDADLWRATAAGRWLSRLTTSRSWDQNPAWAPDGRTIAYESGQPNTHADGCVPPSDTEVRLVSAAGRDLGRLTTAARDPVWSPDGRSIAVGKVSLGDEKDFGLAVIDVGTRRERKLTTGDAGRPSWSPDGREIVVESDGRLLAVDVASGGRRAIGVGSAPAWSPDGNSIAHLSGGRLRVVAAAGGAVTDLGPAAGAFGPILWSPDSRRVALRTRGSVLIATPTGERREVALIGSPLAWSPDGSRFLVAGFVGYRSRPAFGGSARTELYSVPADAGPPVRLSRDFADVVGAAWRAR